MYYFTSKISYKLLLIITLTTLFSLQVSGQGWRPMEMEVQVTLTDRGDAARLAQLQLNGDIYAEHATMYVTPDELQRLDETGLRYEITIENLNDHFDGFWDRQAAYHTYDQVIALMDSLVAALPDLVQKTVYGQSVQGRELSALKITQNVQQYSSRPKIAMDGCIHGDEIGSGENMIRFARWLCQQYGTDPEITGLLNTREVWIYPMVNPDGRVNMTRYNANFVDLNRDGGYLWDGQGGSPGAYSQPESRALRQWYYENEFNIHITNHSGIELFLYPWYFRTEPSPDNSQATTLADVYVSNSGYTNLPSGPGTSLYSTNGTTAETNYGVMGSHGITMEISSNKQPPPSQLMFYFHINLPSKIKMIEYAGYGVGGTITDAVTGEPVQAAVYVGNTLPCYSNPVGGDFHKFMVAGTYNIKVIANGYQTKVVNNIEVQDQSYTTVNIELEPQSHHSIFRVCATRIPGGNMADPGTSWNVIGPPDNLHYSLGKSGWIIIDMLDLVVDGEGDDIIVFEGGTQQEGYSFYAGQSMDGPWVLLGEGTGTTSFDFAGTSISEARFFRIVDDGDGAGNVFGAGFTLDAVQALSSISGPYILLSDYSIDDSGGNNNGQLDPGETVVMTIHLKNIGTEDALNLSGILSSADDLLTIVTANPQPFGDLPVNQTAAASFTIAADENIPAGHQTLLELAYTGDNGVSGSKFIEILFPDYCYPTANCSWGDGFTGFSLLTIDNMNNGCSPNGYGDFTNMTATLEPGQTYTVSWESGYSNQQASLWIDLNNDKLFADSERLITDFVISNSGQVYTANFTVPADAMPGPKRLRIRANWQNSSANPCSNFTYGETEDYTVIIAGEILSADFTADLTELCHQGEVHFTDNSTGNVTAWSWEFPGGQPATSTDPDPVVFYDTPGNWDVTLEVTGGQSSHTAVKQNYISIFALPEIVFGEIPDQCLNYGPWELTEASPHGGVYSGPGVLDGWFYPDVAGLGLHTIYYDYTDENGCSDQAGQQVFVDACTGIEAPEKTFTVFPNPGKGDFFILTDKTYAATAIRVYTTAGEQVFLSDQYNITANEPFRLSLRSMATGTYLIKIGEDRASVVKIIIE
jgi:hypothetical protein